MARSKQQRLVEDRLWELIEPLIPPRPAALPLLTLACTIINTRRLINSGF